MRTSETIAAKLEKDEQVFVANVVGTMELVPDGRLGTLQGTITKRDGPLAIGVGDYILAFNDGRKLRIVVDGNNGRGFTFKSDGPIESA